MTDATQPSDRHVEAEAECTCDRMAHPCEVHDTTSASDDEWERFENLLRWHFNAAIEDGKGSAYIGVGITNAKRDAQRIVARHVEAERERIAQAIEARRNEHWQKHLAEHPYADARSCPEDYGKHDAYYDAARIARETGRTEEEA